MIATFESILPIFLLIAAGHVLRRIRLVDDAAWPGLEQLGYWFLYPALLFVTIYNADFSGLEWNGMLAALAIAIMVTGAGTALLWLPLRRYGLATAAEFSSMFQTSVRWNGFMALAIADKIFPQEGAAVVALMMAFIIVPINIESVIVVSRFADRDANWSRIGRTIALNPLILASVAGLAMRFVPVGFYEPLNQTLGLVGRAALGMGLLTIGAGLRLGDALRPRLPVLLPVGIKLVAFPALLVSLAWSFGVDGAQLEYLALCAAVPTAMNGYLLARQLGGDAELYAAVTTVQTAAAFFTIPAVLGITAYVVSG
ncbi:MAG: AEC family transporter [Mesorhizobium sp.]